MPAIAHFTFSVVGLTVTCTDSSSGGPLFWEWSFGDGTSVVTTQDAVHTYSHNGYYSISLKVKILVGDLWSTAYVLNVGVSSYGDALSQSISVLIDQRLPTGVTLDIANKNNLIQKYQLYLQPLVAPAVAKVNTYNEFAYPPLANQLIVELVALDLVINGANAFLIGLGTGGAGKEVKQITTGPAEAQWFSSSESWASIMKSGGLYDQIRAQACGLSEYLNIQLAFCKKLNKLVFAPTVSRPVTSYPTVLIDNSSSIPSQG